MRSYLALYKISAIIHQKLGTLSSITTTTGSATQARVCVTLQVMFNKECYHDLVNIRESYTILTDIFQI